MQVKPIKYLPMGVTYLPKKKKPRKKKKKPRIMYGHNTK